MARISDELREWADVHCGEECVEYLGLLADRIDRDMVELPRDIDGVPIHVGDTLYVCDTGKQFQVKSLHLEQRWGVSTNARFVVDTSRVTHELPDSWERIADDIEAAEDWRDQNGDYGTGITSVSEATLLDWAERIRNLAAKE